MEVLVKRYQALCKALSTLDEVIKKMATVDSYYYKEVRDSMIQRFEYSVDLLWKTLRDYLLSIEGITTVGSSPRAVYQTCLDISFFSQQEFKQALILHENRNTTSHVYKEEIAEEVSKSIPPLYAFMNMVAERLETKIISADQSLQ